MNLWLTVDGARVWLPAIAGLGGVVGYVAGLFGVGGGFLLTPLLVVAFHVPLRVAVGTGVCQIVGTSLAALLRHQSSGQGELRFDLLMLPGSLIGVYAGERALSSLAALGAVQLVARPVPLVSLVVESGYVVLLAIAASFFWRQGAGGAHEATEFVRSGPLARVSLGPAIDLPRVPLRRVSAPLVAYLGLAMGFLSGLLGIGGGIALMPVLIYGYGFPIRQAAGTGIFVLFASATVGTVLHALRGNVSLPLAMVLLAAATLSAQLGARHTRRLPARLLRRMLAWVIVATAVAVAWDLTSRIR